MVVNHPQPSDKKKWNKEWPTIEERINTLFSKMKDVQVNDKEGNPIPKMIVSDPFIKKLWKEIESDPKKKNGNLMLGFEYFFNLWVEDKIKVDGIIPWKDFRENVRNALKIILDN